MDPLIGQLIVTGLILCEALFVFWIILLNRKLDKEILTLHIDAYNVVLPITPPNFKKKVKISKRNIDYGNKFLNTFWTNLEYDYNIELIEGETWLVITKK